MFVYLMNIIIRPEGTNTNTTTLKSEVFETLESAKEYSLSWLWDNKNIEKVLDILYGSSVCGAIGQEADDGIRYYVAVRNSAGVRKGLIRIDIMLKTFNPKYGDS